MSAARPAYGLPGVGVTDEGSTERSRGASNVLPLLILVVALAAATIWLVALPALAAEPQVKRSCEVFVLPSGTIKCVSERGSSPAQKSRAKPSRRAKR